MSDKNVDFMRKIDREEVEENTLPTQQNKNSSGMPCFMCNSAFVDDDLDCEHDLSCISVGGCPDGWRFMLCAGAARPVRLEVESYDYHLVRWVPIGVFYPKFCPNCGRQLSEFHISDRFRSYTNIEQVGGAE